MGSVIRAVATARAGRSPRSHGARRLADTALRRCMQLATRPASELDILINAGVYRERGLGEPALAALIQEDVHAGDGDVSAPGHGTFSFDIDIDNGNCGVLTGAYLLDGFLDSGAIDLGAVVVSDSGPDPVHAHDLPYDEGGGALLLERDDEVEGFLGFDFRTFPEFAELSEGYWQWHEHAVPMPGRPPGGNRLKVVQRPGFRERAAECAAEAAGKFLADKGVPAGSIDLLIAAPESRFADPLADRLGIDRQRVMHSGEQIARLHTTEVVASLELARRNRRWSEAGTVLFVVAGSGITVASALYRR